MAKIFVFGSNLAGIHGAGSAVTARRDWGAAWGVGVGLSGSSYAIPTKGTKLEVLPLPVIQGYVNSFLEFACAHPELEFYVTKIGCGLAGYKNEDIAPMFKNAPANCELHPEWITFNERVI